MEKCCTVDNVDQSTADGTLGAKVNVLICRTCKTQQTYVYKEYNTNNALYSYCRLTRKRIAMGMPVFSEQQDIRNL